MKDGTSGTNNDNIRAKAPGCKSLHRVRCPNNKG